MSELTRAALASLPLTETQVAELYRQGAMTPKEVRALCVSHERLRAEVKGAEILLRESGLWKENDNANGQGSKVE